MTITLNNRKTPEPARLQEEARGLFVVKDAYKGEFEYFEGRPLPAVAPEAENKGSEK